MMSYSPHELLQGRKAAPQARFLGAHPNLEVTFQVLRAMQRQPQEVDGFRALSAAFTRMSLREPTELNQLGFGRLKSETELFQPKAQRVLPAFRIASESRSPAASRRMRREGRWRHRRPGRNVCRQMRTGRDTSRP